MKIGQCSITRRRPIGLVDPDGIRDRRPVRADGLVVDSDDRTAGVEEDLRLWVCLSRDSKGEGTHEPERSGRVVYSDCFEGGAVGGVDGAEAESTAGVSHVEEGGEDGGVEFVLDQFDEGGGYVCDCVALICQYVASLSNQLLLERT